MALASAATNAVLVAVAVVGLAVSAGQFVAGAGGVARRLGLSGLLVGLTVVAFGTSAPEFAVTLDAALTSKSNISVGNVVGSNIFNLGFILGGVALIRALPVSTALVRRDGLSLIGATGLALVLLSDLRLSQLEGVLLVVLLGGYLAVLVRTGSEQLKQSTASDASGSWWLDPLRAVAGLAGIIVSAHVLVSSAAALARFAGVSEWVIGVTIVAAGTSAPEFATSVAAARRGQAGLSAGNLVGSSIFNLLGVLGLAAIVRPLSVVGTAVDTTLWLFGLTVIATAFFWSNEALSRLEGGALVVLSAANWVVDFLG
ncbi:sodium:calcium antiporter [Halobellus sp. Atlit-38R]|uniref:calcium/sodium antiporter n=1 Tax=Halobellus sp. Atlit-38R TaxID=2282131 RepID=UPI000EF1FAC8|nr:calcium/sodium antiporter [Halobellus sp. Atlit-38R]RLM94688.1 sodium:calcium antiporter [Halobellus sp. Atlit-38R]